MNTPGFRRILLATDGSKQAAEAVTASFAQASSGGVRVVHACSLELVAQRIP